MQRRSVNHFNPFRSTSGESQWVNFMKEQGSSKEEIIANVYRQLGGFGEHTQLVVEYMLGERPLSDIEFVLTPHEPTQIELIEKVSDGYLLQASGSKEASFPVLLRAPSLDESAVEELIAQHQDELCYLAYRNAHEGLPCGYTRLGAPIAESLAAKAGISYADIAILLPE